MDQATRQQLHDPENSPINKQVEKINSVTDLKAAIQQLERKQADEVIKLKEEIHFAFESLKPLNLIKSTIREAASSGELKDNLLNTTAGLSAGFLVKKLFVGKSNNPLKKTAGNIIMFGITNMMAKNPGFIPLLGKKIWDLAIKRPSGQNRKPVQPVAVKQLPAQ